MTKWKITTPKGEVLVEAHQANTTSAGVLYLSENSGQIIRAFAPGAWLECEMVERGTEGYYPHA